MLLLCSLHAPPVFGLKFDREKLFGFRANRILTCEEIDFRKQRMKSLFIIGFILCGLAKAFYLPGVAPHNFGSGDNVELKVNKLR